jgi:large subunit ribosomal protein L15
MQHTLKSSEGSRKDRKRIGRGRHRGSYSGRGVKGQNARTGGGVRIGFEGGQIPLIRRMPKLKGFKNPNRVELLVVNLEDLNRVFKDGDTVNGETLRAKGVLKKKRGEIKLLGTGTLERKLTIQVRQASETAKAKVEKAGGTLELIA